MTKWLTHADRHQQIKDGNWENKTGNVHFAWLMLTTALTNVLEKKNGKNLTHADEDLYQ